MGFHFIKCLDWEQSSFAVASVTAHAVLFLLLTALPFTAVQCSFFFHFLPPVGRAWHEESVL